MALTYDQISAITQRKIIPKLVDNIFDSNPLLQRAKSKFYESVDGGIEIQQPLNYALSAAGDWYTGSETLDTTDTDVMTSANFAWKTIYEPITIRRLDELKNSGDSAKLKFVAQKTQIAEKSLMDKMGTAMWNAGSASNAIAGLRYILSTSNSPGGISQSTYSWWAAQVNSSSTVLTLSVLNTLDQLCTIGNDGPSVGLTTRTLYNSLYGLFTPQQRFQDNETAKGGFSSLMINGKAVIVDSHCPANHFAFLNEKYLHLYYHPDENFRFEPFAKPVNQNVKVAKIFWAGALGSSNNRMHGLASALTS